MDDRIDVDLDNKRLIGKDTKRYIGIGDDVRVRIVSVSLNERSPRESRIGLTMRQPALGKMQWIDEDLKGKPEAKKKKKKKGKEKGKKKK
jgi:DNA-directed RNA polymerase subunit E'